MRGLQGVKAVGDSSSYDIGVEYGRHFFRMQVKSTSYQIGNGYLCAFKPNRKGRRNTTKSVDFFAAYVIPENAWYVLPSSAVLKTKSNDLMLCPVRRPKRDLYRYEGYREAWNLLRSPTMHV